MKLEEIADFLKGRIFVNVGTSDLQGHPNCAPKFLLKTEGSHIYIIDYSIGKTAKNLKVNPRVSISYMNQEELIGYKFGGAAEIISEGKFYDQILGELKRKQVELSASRLIEGVRTGKRYQHYEIEIPNKFLIYRVAVKEITKIGPRGELWKKASSF